MTHRHLKTHGKPPLWAALGAPLVGVPLMVGLLALGASDREAPAAEPVPAAVTEPVDTYGIEPVSTDSAEGLDRQDDG